MASAQTNRATQAAGYGRLLSRPNSMESFTRKGKEGSSDRRMTRAQAHAPASKFALPLPPATLGLDHEAGAGQSVAPPIPWN